MMFTTRDTEGHTQMCLTFNFKVNHQGQVIDFRFSEILDIVNVRIDTKIEFVSCLEPEIRKVIQKGVWPWFSRSCNKDRIFSLSPLDSLTPKHIHEKYFQKIRTERQKSRGGGTPLGVRRWIFTLGVRGLKYSIFDPDLIEYWSRK